MELLKQIDENELNFCSYNKIVANLAYINKCETSKIEVELKKLINQGKLINTSKNKFATFSKAGYLEGRISTTKSGHAFFISSAENEQDLFIEMSNLHGAMNNDKVIVRKLFGKKSNKGLDECEVVKILAHGTNNIVGKVDTITHNFAFIRVNNKKMKDVLVRTSNLMNAQVGDSVVVKILKYDSVRPEGKVIEVIKTDNPVLDDVLSIVREYELYEEFPDFVLQSAKAVEQQVSNDEIARRRDLRELNTFTIDGEDARDFDDAISISMNDDGTYHLGVHIADVGHYVKKDSILDAEAFKRGTSTYFPNAVFPMLPVELSNGICSLNEGVDRLTLSVFMDIDENGRVINHEVCEGVIKSKARMTYTKVAKMLDGDAELNEKYSFLVDDLQKMKALALILENVRKSRGSLDFEIPEPKIIFNNETMKIERFERRENTMADRIIESFMLIANETIAKMFSDLDIPFVYRVHDKPTVEKLKTFSSFISSFGLSLGTDVEEISNLDIQRFLKSTENLEYRDVINSVMLRCMQKAKYRPTNDGHFGLGAKNYCHFTSPIRRYPDLTIHRIIKDYLNNRLNVDEMRKLKSFVQESSEQSSLREVVSEKAERDVDDYFKALYLKDFIGSKFEGIVSGVTENGIFVELENTCEGFIPVECLPDKSYEFVDTKYLLHGATTKYQLGDKLNIIVESSDPQSRRVNFSLDGCNKKRTKKNGNECEC